MNTQNFNAVNDAQGEVVDTHTTATESGEDVSCDIGEVASPRQSAETNAAFAAMRRSMQQERREKEKALAEVSRLAGRQNENAVSINDNSAADSEIATLREQLELYRNMESERQFSSDLEEIKREFPSETAENIGDLGLTFIRLRACGIDNLTAYRAIAVQRNAEIGSVGVDASTEPRLYSSEELDALTSEQLDNPGIFSLAMKSMRKLR